MTLQLIKPADPYEVTQSFGIFNPAYTQFGFDHHNGIDFRIDRDGIVVAMCEGEVYEVGYNSAAGNFVRYRTLQKVDAEGHTDYVGFMYMHAKTQLVKTGDKVVAGTPLIVADNTGFSTGPHTHISAYFLDIASGLKLPYGQANCDYCFDFSKYYTPDLSPVYATAEQKNSIMKALDWLKLLLNNLKK